MAQPEAGSHSSPQTLPSSPVLLLLRLHRAFTALLATHSKVESPSSLLRIPNSTSKDPAPAVQVSLWLSGGTPFFRFTCEQGQAGCSQPAVLTAAPPSSGTSLLGSFGTMCSMECAHRHKPSTLLLLGKLSCGIPDILLPALQHHA